MYKTLSLMLLSLHQISAATIPAQPAIDLDSLEDTAFKNQSLTMNSTSLQYPGSREIPDCNGNYGYVEFRSCYIALRQLPNDDLRPVVFGPRQSASPAQQPLPSRFSSGKVSHIWLPIRGNTEPHNFRLRER